MPTVLEIDSKAVKSNIHYLRSKLKPKTGLMVVVKAFSYGSDAVVIARLLEELKVDYLAVSYTQEGIDLQKCRHLSAYLGFAPANCLHQSTYFS
ncbi:MAG: alanine racemase [Flavobacteriaceae bacterium]|nr:alanine racemase [Flavobacteriaceae bacterium]